MSAEHGSTALQPAQLPGSSGHEQTIVAVEDIGTGQGVDHGDNDVDVESCLGSDNFSVTTDLTSTAYDFIWENGRIYHAFQPEKSYFLLNDEKECDRQDMVHHLLTLLAAGKLHSAPIGPDPQRILDLGTGTGIWAIDMGDKYPSAQVLGNDISPVQPTDVPPNVNFELDDVERDWLYLSKFDFIHGRCLTGSIKDWPRLVGQAYQFLKPGGWIELQEINMTFSTVGGGFKKNCFADRWTHNVMDGLRTLGMEPEPGPQLEEWVRGAGFTHISATRSPLPLGPWPKDKNLKEVGAFNLLQFRDGLEAMSLRVFTKVHGWTLAEVQVLLAKVRKDLVNPRIQMQHDYFIVYG